MIVLVLTAVLGLLAGFLLVRRVPTCLASRPVRVPNFSIVIPARNEEGNLPRLLQSIQASSAVPHEVIVVDDASKDRSAEVARQFGACVIPSRPLPADWTGKAWACFQGAWHSSGDYILFLDADTFFIEGGLDRLIATSSHQTSSETVLSALPYHQTSAAYEQLSLFFNLLMAVGAGGFSGLSRPQLFGQCLFISRAMYFASGGHAVVRDAVIENLSLAQPLRERGAHIICIGGRGTLHMRMFPEGMRQMTQSWSKSFVRGAAASSATVLLLSAMWIAALCSIPLMPLLSRGVNGIALCLAYLLLCLQLALLSRKFGNFRFWSCLLYPLPLTYYCIVFFSAAARRAAGRKFAWRGREV